MYYCDNKKNIYQLLLCLNSYACRLLQNQGAFRYINLINFSLCYISNFLNYWYFRLWGFLIILISTCGILIILISTSIFHKLNNSEISHGMVEHLDRIGERRLPKAVNKAGNRHRLSGTRDVERPKQRFECTDSL